MAWLLKQQGNSPYRFTLSPRKVNLKIIRPTPWPFFSLRRDYACQIN